MMKISYVTMNSPFKYKNITRYEQHLKIFKIRISRAMFFDEQSPDSQSTVDFHQLSAEIYGLKQYIELKKNYIIKLPIKHKKCSCMRTNKFACTIEENFGRCPQILAAARVTPNPP